MEAVYQEFFHELHKNHATTVSPGQALYKENDSSNQQVYFILHGDLEIYRGNNYLLTLGEGQFGGLLSGLLSDKFHETAVAGKSGTKVIFFSATLFEKLLMQNHQFGLAMISKAINFLSNVHHRVVSYSIDHIPPRELETRIEAKIISLRHLNLQIPEALYSMRKRPFRPKEYIFHETDDRDQNTYLIIDGSFQVRNKMRGHEVPVFNLFPGDILAFFPDVKKLPRDLSLFTLTKQSGNLMILDHELINNIARSNSHLLYSLFESILLNLYLRVRFLN